MLTVKDLMQSEVATLQVADHLDLADDVMHLGRIRHMPVEENGRVVGILTQRDLLRAGISSVLRFRSTSEREWLAKIAVAEAMTSPVTTIAADEPLSVAVRLMAEQRIGCLPVTEGEQLVGLLSETDLLRYLGRLLDEESSVS